MAAPARVAVCASGLRRGARPPSRAMSLTIQTHPLRPAQCACFVPRPVPTRPATAREVRMPPARVAALRRSAVWRRMAMAAPGSRLSAALGHDAGRESQCLLPQAGRLSVALHCGVHAGVPWRSMAVLRALAFPRHVFLRATASDPALMPAHAQASTQGWGRLLRSSARRCAAVATAWAVSASRVRLPALRSHRRRRSGPSPAHRVRTGRAAVAAARSARPIRVRSDCAGNRSRSAQLQIGPTPARRQRKDVGFAPVINACDQIDVAQRAQRPML